MHPRLEAASCAGRRRTKRGGRPRSLSACLPTPLASRLKRSKSQRSRCPALHDSTRLIRMIARCSRNCRAAHWGCALASSTYHHPSWLLQVRRLSGASHCSQRRHQHNNGNEKEPSPPHPHVWHHSSARGRGVQAALHHLALHCSLCTAAAAARGRSPAVGPSASSLLMWKHVDR